MFLAKKTDKSEKLWDQQCILEKNSALSMSIDDHHSRRAERVLILVSALTMLFVLTEFVGGYLAHSLAVITDAFHMLSDLCSFIVSIVAIRLSRCSPTSRHSFGFQRAEVLGALSSILVIWVLTGALLYLAILRIIDHEYEVEPNTMMLTAGIGVCFNVLIGALLHLVWHTAGSNNVMAHTHGHAHSLPSAKEVAAAEEGSSVSSSVAEYQQNQHTKNLNIRAAFVHVLGDLVQSLGVLIAALIIKFTGYAIADPICTFMFSILVLLTTVSVFGDTLTILMEASPSQVDHQKLYTDLITLPGVVGVHSLRVWSLKMDTFAATVHLELASSSGSVKDKCLADSVVAMAQQKLVSRHRIRFVTVQTHCRQMGSIADEEEQEVTAAHQMHVISLSDEKQQ
uniref:Zinc transporter 2 n=1 Tax=Globodera rostochiensis TaxID=31243 RepID=A0A914H7B4_GLORO